MNVCSSPLSGISPPFEGNLALGRIWLKPKCFLSATLFAVKFWEKIALIENLFCSSPLFHFPARKLLFGSILGVISRSLSLSHL